MSPEIGSSRLKRLQFQGWQPLRSLCHAVFKGQRWLICLCFKFLGLCQHFFKSLRPQEKRPAQTERERERETGTDREREREGEREREREGEREREREKKRERGTHKSSNQTPHQQCLKSTDEKHSMLEYRVLSTNEHETQTETFYKRFVSDDASSYHHEGQACKTRPGPNQTSMN